MALRMRGRASSAILAKFIHAALVCAVAWARPKASSSEAGSLAFWPMISLASLMALIMPFWRMMSAALADAFASSVSWYAATISLAASACAWLAGRYGLSCDASVL